MNKLEFITPEGQEPNREEFVLFVNTGTREAPDWQPLGSGNEDSSVSYDWNTSSATDILGNVKITANKPSRTQDLDPLPLTVGQKAVEYLWEKLVWEENVQAARNMDVLEVYKYARWKNGGGIAAKRYPSSGIFVTGHGGAGGAGLGMPLQVMFGGEKQMGKVEISAENVVTFTKGEPVGT